ncbi:MAG: type IIL restriction-modification enzyme MmeI [Candidatus Dormibacteria bacterium]
MPVRSGIEIQGRLEKFAHRWKSYRGTERSEAQTFLNELFQAYGQDRLSAGALFENPQADGGIVDLLYPGVAIIEMKAPAETRRLETHRKQALDYWHHSDDPQQGRAAPPYVILCSFHRFEVWEPGRYPSAPRDTFDLAELADRYEALLFLGGQQPLFLAHHRHLTTAAAERVALLNETLSERAAAEPAVIRRFLLQSVWCLFAEGVGLLEHRPFTQIVQALLADPARSSAAELGHLFTGLNLISAHERSALGGMYADLPYVDGGLFTEPARVHLAHQELQTLADVAGFDWREVDPTIFGALMEDCLGRQRRWELGAHYTYEADILRIVLPSIIAPWSERILSTSSVPDAVRTLEELCRLRILDPACGCGNFLYVAYREVRGLEQQAKAHIAELCRAAGIRAPTALPSYPISNLFGIEIDEFAALIARMTLWMGHKLVTDRYGLVEPGAPPRGAGGDPRGRRPGH